MEHCQGSPGETLTPTCPYLFLLNGAPVRYLIVYNYIYIYMSTHIYIFIHTCDYTYVYIYTDFNIQYTPRDFTCINLCIYALMYDILHLPYIYTEDTYVYLNIHIYNIAKYIPHNDNIIYNILRYIYMCIHTHPN